VFRLATQIAEPPRIKERSGAATRRELIEPRNRGGLVTQRILEATVRAYFEVTEVSAGFGQCLVGKPDRESNDRCRRVRCDANDMVDALCCQRDTDFVARMPMTLRHGTCDREVGMTPPTPTAAATAEVNVRASA
jgi:hypothetical protein